MNGESLWPRLARLTLVIEACEYERFCECEFLFRFRGLRAQHADAVALCTGRCPTP